MTGPRSWRGLACAAAFLVPVPAFAQSRCPGIKDGAPELEAQSPEARLAAIREVMDHQARRGRTWTYAWLGIAAGLAAESWIEFPFVDKDKRLAQGLVGITPAYIPLSLFLFPLHANRDHEALEEYVALTSTSLGPIGPCLQVDRAEELLTDAADDEAWHTALGQHITTIVLSIAYTAFLQVAFHDPQYTWVDGAGSLLVGEVQLLTTPTGAVDALARYRKGDLAGAMKSASGGPGWTLAPMVAGPGVSLMARF